MSEMVCSPCKYCTERRLGCHGICTKYNNYLIEKQKQADWLRDSKPPRMYMKDYTTSGPRPGKNKRTKNKSAWYR